MATTTKTFEDFDLFEMAAYADRLESFLLVEKDYVDGSLVVGLNAPFGSGKSTFIEMWSNRLTGRRNYGDASPIPVILSAWESDHCSDPLIAILAELIAALERVKGDKVPETVNLKEAAKDVGWMLLSVGNDLAAGIIGADMIKAAELSERKRTARNEPTVSITDLHLKRMAALSKIRSELGAAFRSTESQVIIFVDELDRCRPDYAISYLEAIKHMFDVNGIIFVLAFNQDQLANSARSLFGPSLNFHEYLRKFCHRVFTLPEREERHIRNISIDYAKRYLAVEGRRSSRLKVDPGMIDRLFNVIDAYQPQPRQVQEAFRILGHAMATDNSENVGNLNWGYTAAAVLLSFIRVLNPDDFHKIHTTNNSDEALLTIGENISSAFKPDKREWWIKLVFSGWGISYPASGNKLAIYNRLGYSVMDHSVFDGFSSGWNHSDENQILRMMRMIERADKL